MSLFVSLEDQKPSNTLTFLGLLDDHGGGLSLPYLASVRKGSPSSLGRLKRPLKLLKKTRTYQVTKRYKKDIVPLLQKNKKDTCLTLKTYKKQKNIQKTYKTNIRKQENHTKTIQICAMAWNRVVLANRSLVRRRVKMPRQMAWPLTGTRRLCGGHTIKIYLA